MAKGRNIQGITVEIGGDTGPLQKALNNLNRPISQVQSELRDVERLLKMDPGNADLVAQKQRMLAQQIENTTQKLETLKQADKTAKAQLESGDLGQDKYDALQREIVETEQKLEGLKTAQKNTRTEMFNAQTGITDFGGKLSDLGGKAKAAGDALMPVSTAAGALLGAAVATIPATEELRTDLSFLETNAKNAGVGIDTATTAFDTFNTVSGETDSSIEGVSNLLQAGFTESNLQKAVEGLAGAANSFADTLKID